MKNRKHSKICNRNFWCPENQRFSRFFNHSIPRTTFLGTLNPYGFKDSNVKALEKEFE